MLYLSVKKFFEKDLMKWTQTGENENPHIICFIPSFCWKKDLICC